MHTLTWQLELSFTIFEYSEVIILRTCETFLISHLHIFKHRSACNFLSPTGIYFHCTFIFLVHMFLNATKLKWCYLKIYSFSLKCNTIFIRYSLFNQLYTLPVVGSTIATVYLVTYNKWVTFWKQCTNKTSFTVPKFFLQLENDCLWRKVILTRVQFLATSGNYSQLFKQNCSRQKHLFIVLKRLPVC